MELLVCLLAGLTAAWLGIGLARAAARKTPQPPDPCTHMWVIADVQQSALYRGICEDCGELVAR